MIVENYDLTIPSFAYVYSELYYFGVAYLYFLSFISLITPVATTEEPTLVIATTEYIIGKISTIISL